MCPRRPREEEKGFMEFISNPANWAIRVFISIKRSELRKHGILRNLKYCCRWIYNKVCTRKAEQRVCFLSRLSGNGPVLFHDKLDNSLKYDD